MNTPFGILRFREQYFERIWGGQRLRTLLHKTIPPDRPIGEAWLLSDHPSAVSIVSDGPHAGRTLHELLEEDAVSLVGAAKLTPYGRFPLLLKILDSSDILSVQVHPDDATAMALGESDIGKTEMWHVLYAEPNADLYCGLLSGSTKEGIRSAIETGTLEQHLIRFNVKPGDSIMVNAGTVHAIGAGIVVAEIQQNSDLTYRLYDWNRVDSSGRSRALHIDKGLRAIDFLDNATEKYIDVMSLHQPAIFSNLASSSHFRVYMSSLTHETEFDTKNRYNIILPVSTRAIVSSGTQEIILNRGECCLVPASISKFTIDGDGSVLIYTS